ncbi:MAG TPA: hypothetical protein VI873_02805, partial [Candidatus Peribacteraceae bacterium]|nr:hypothetical protein [Candidatus Peribacteraceae bacterium]
MDPTATALFVCSNKESDAQYLRAEGVPFETLPLPRRSIALPLTLYRAIRRSKRILRRSKPVAIFSKGGAVSV